MFIEQSGLFKNLSQSALEVIWGYRSEKACNADDLVFREGEEAETFYILKEGTVHLLMGDMEELCFIVDHPGEIFGWSALVEPYHYRASARCTSRTSLVMMPREAIERASKDYPEDGITIFRNLAAIVTEKLREAYQNMLFVADREEAATAAGGELKSPT